MARLIAIDLPAGPAFVDTIRSAWDDGDGVFVVDRRISQSAKVGLLDQVGPHTVISDDPIVAAAASPEAAPLLRGDRLVIATSGTSGKPKLVVLSADALVSQTRSVNDRLEVDVRSDRWLACLPLAHLGGLGVVIRSLLSDTPVDVVDGFDPDAVAAAPATVGSTLVSLVPTAMARTSVSGYRKVLVGGAADLGAQPANVVRTYGLTETGGGVVYDGLALDGCEVRVGEDAEVSLRGPMLARGYRQRDGQVTALVDDEGWFATGDRGAWVSGRLVIHGRTDDMIVTGGENVWPDPVEAVIATHRSVAEVAVVGRADPEWGERVVAIIVPTDPKEPPSLEVLRAMVKESMPPWCAPRELVVAQSLPRTALGKVRRRDLRLDAPIGPRSLDARSRGSQ